MANPITIFAIASSVLTVSGLIYLSWSLMSNPFEPDVASLEDNDVFKDSNSPYKNKYGDKYRRYLMDANKFIADNAESFSTNDQWWEYKYKMDFVSNKPLEGRFSTVESVEDLKNTCDGTYREEPNRIDSFLEKHIWKFCSAEENKVQSIEEVEIENYPDGTYGDVYKKDLIAANTHSNEEYWSFQLIGFVFYYAIIEMSQQNVEDNSVFKELYLKGGMKYTTLRDKCKEAYGTNPVGNTSFPIDKVFQFCSIKGKQEGNA